MLVGVCSLLFRRDLSAYISRQIVFNVDPSNIDILNHEISMLFLLMFRVCVWVFGWISRSEILVGCACFVAFIAGRSGRWMGIVVLRRTCNDYGRND